MIFSLIGLDTVIITIMFLIALGLCCCTRAFLVALSRDCPLVAVRGFLTAVASLVAEYSLLGADFSSCGAWA